jgi:hypothetical protein
MKSRFFIPLCFLSASILFSTSCYYDNEEKLYEGYLAACDTTGISFSKDIKPIFAVNCDNCHSTATAPILGAGINLDGPARIAAYELQFPGRLYGSVAQVRPYSPMPKGGRKLDNCSLSKIDAWIKAGIPDN